MEAIWDRYARCTDLESTSSFFEARSIFVGDEINQTLALISPPTISRIYSVEVIGTCDCAGQKRFWTPSTTNNRANNRSTWRIAENSQEQPWINRTVSMRIRKREFDFSRVGRRHRRKLIDVETSLDRKLTAGQTNFTIVFPRVILILPIRYDTLTDFTLCKMLINTGGSIHRPRPGSHEFSFRSSRTKRPVFS